MMMAQMQRLYEDRNLLLVKAVQKILNHRVMLPQEVWFIGREKSF